MDEAKITMSNAWRHVLDYLEKKTCGEGIIGALVADLRNVEVDNVLTWNVYPLLDQK